MSQPNSENQSAPQRQTVGDVTVSGDENPVALVNAAGNTAIDQSRHIIYNYYYYREEPNTIPVEAAALTDNLPCPYRGLFHFGPDNAEFFFGREVFVDELVQAVQFGRQTVVTELLQAVQTRAFISVLGASGSGKSSVVFAGLVPQLQRAGHWQFTHFRPGEDPFHALSLALVPLYQPEQDATDQIAQARKLANFLRSREVLLKDLIAQIQQYYPQDRVLLIADQFEELYTLCTEDSTRHQFLDCLLDSLSDPQDASSPLVLVATMRADFLGNALSYRPFADVLKAGDIKLGAMNRKELQAVIEQPAAKLGVTFESGLVQRILQDVESEPGNLPLLEFALTELWQRRTGKQLTHEAYTAIEEVQGALARHADASYSQLSFTEQDLARHLMMELVQLGQDQDVTRKRASWDQLRAVADAPEQVNRVIGKLVKQRLIVTNEKTVEVAHEALLTQWPLLRQLIQENRHAIRLRNQLTNNCQEWQEQQQSKDYLLSLGRLAVFEEWIKRDQPRLPIVEIEYLQHSRENHDRIFQAQLEQERRLREAAEQRELAEIEKTLAAEARVEAESERTKEAIARANAEKRGKRFAILTAISLAGIAALAINLNFISEQRETAIVNALISEPQQLAKENFQLEVLLSTLRVLDKIKGNHEKVPNAIHDIIRNIHELNRIKGHQDQVIEVSFDKSGDHIISASFDKTVRVWNKKGKSLRILDCNDGLGIWGAKFSPDGQLIAAADSNGLLRIWDIKKGRKWKLKPPDFQEGDFALKLSFNHRNNLLGVAYSNENETGGVKLFNLTHGTFLKTLQLGKQRVRVLDVSFHPQKSLIASANDDGTIRLWDFSTGKLVKTFVGHDKLAYAVEFSPDGRTVASASWDKTIRIWDLKGNQISVLKGHTDEVNSISYSPSGKFLASGSKDETVRVWDVRSGNLLSVFKGHTDAVNSVAFAPNEKEIVSGSDDKTIRLWSISNKTIDPDNSGTNLLVDRICIWIADYLTINSSQFPQENSICTNRLDFTKNSS